MVCGGKQNTIIPFLAAYESMMAGSVMSAHQEAKAVAAQMEHVLFKPFFKDF